MSSSFINKIVLTSLMLVYSHEEFVPTQLWKYNEGQVTHVGIGHSDQITTARICPNRRLIVSGGADGAIHIWRFPADLP